mgnify:CR=1 FL=1|jgi:6-pyruvoyl-tetrahydropterin synthase
MHLFVDQLTNVDFSFLHAERGMLGETWLANVQLDGSLDEQGMVCDFGIVKKTLRNWLDDQLDHRLAVPIKSPNLTISEDGDYISLSWTYGREGERPETLSCRAPRQAIALVDAESITAESTAQWCVSQLLSEFPNTLQQLNLQFSLEDIVGSFYHYSHGLKKHDGNCQRIAHGHRSCIEIWQDGERSPSLEKGWAERWRDIYIGSEDDVVGSDNLHLGFAYRAAQGDFDLNMPRSSCYMVDTDTTVELLAAHIAETLKSENPNSSIVVRAYEGIGKGAQVSLPVGKD